MALSQAAGRVEAAIKTGQKVHAALAALALSLDGVVEAIRAVLPDEIAASGTGSGSTDHATVVALLGRLKLLLESDDGEAADFIVDAEPSLSGVLTAAEIATFSRLVGNTPRRSEFEQWSSTFKPVECLPRQSTRICQICGGPALFWNTSGLVSPQDGASAPEQSQ